MYLSKDTTPDEFMDELYRNWASRPSGTFSFACISEEDYNSYLDHRHGWPITAKGECGPCSASSEDDHMGPVWAEDCHLCHVLVLAYEEATRNHYDWPQHGEDPPVACEVDSTGRVAFVFPEGTAHLLLTEDGFEVIMDRDQYKAWEKQHFAMVKKMTMRDLRMVITWPFRRK